MVEAAAHFFAVAILLTKRFRVPLLAARRKEIAAVDMQRARQTSDGIGDRMNDVVAERKRVLLADGLGAGGSDFAAAVGQASPENIVLPSGVDSDHCSHLVVVGQQRHPRGPNLVKNRELRRLVQLDQFTLLWLRPTP